MRNIKQSPWYVNVMGNDCETCDGADRLRQVRESSDAEWLRRVITYPHNQRAVQKAAEAKLRKLTKHEPILNLS